MPGLAEGGVLILITGQLLVRTCSAHAFYGVAILVALSHILVWI